MNKSIDAYLNSLPSAEKEALADLRRTLMAISNFEEFIYYGMPALRYNGEAVACFRAYSKHIGFYPCSGSILRNFSAELKKYKTTVGAVQFPKGEKLPKALIRKIVRARMNEIDLELKSK